MKNEPKYEVITERTYDENTKTAYHTIKEIDLETGEVTETHKEKHYGALFHKLYKKELCKALKGLTGAQLEVFVFILQKMKNHDNSFNCKVSDIIKSTRLSNKTVSAALDELQKRDFIRKVKQSCYMVSPYVIVQGDPKKVAYLKRAFDSLDSRMRYRNQKS